MAAATMASLRPQSCRNLMVGFAESDEYVEEIVVEDDEYYEEIIVDDDASSEYLEIVLEDDEEDPSSSKKSGGIVGGGGKSKTDVDMFNGRATQRQVDGLSFAEAKKFLLGLPNTKDNVKQALEFEYNSDDDSVYEEYVLPDEITAIRKSRRTSIFAAPDLEDLIEENSEHSKSISSLRSGGLLASPSSIKEDRKVAMKTMDAIQEQNTPGADAENNGVATNTPVKVPEHIKISLDDSPAKSKSPLAPSERTPSSSSAAAEVTQEDILPEGTILSGALNDTDEKDDIRIVKTGKPLPIQQSQGHRQPKSSTSVESEGTHTTAGTSSSSFESIPPISPGMDSVNSKKNNHRTRRQSRRSSIENGATPSTPTSNKPSSSSSVKSEGDYTKSPGSSKGRVRSSSRGSNPRDHHHRRSSQQKRPDGPPLTMEDELMNLISSPQPPPPPSKSNDLGGSSTSLGLHDLELLKSRSGPSHNSLPVLPPVGPNTPVKSQRRSSQHRPSSGSGEVGEKNSLGDFFSNAPAGKKIDRDCRSAYSSTRRRSSRRSGGSSKSVAPLPTNRDSQSAIIPKSPHRAPRRGSTGGSAGIDQLKRESHSLTGTVSTTSLSSASASTTPNDQRQESTSPKKEEVAAQESCSPSPPPPPAPVSDISIPSPQPAPEKPGVSAKTTKPGLDNFLSRMSDKPTQKIDRDAQSTYSAALGGRRRSSSGRGRARGGGDCQSVVSSATSARRRSSSQHRGRGRTRNKSSVAKDANDDQSIASMPALANKSRRARSASVGRKNRIRRSRRAELENAKEKWNQIATASPADKDENGFPRAAPDPAPTSSAAKTESPRQENNTNDSKKNESKPRDMGAALKKIADRDRRRSSGGGGRSRQGSVAGSGRSVGSGSKSADRSVSRSVGSSSQPGDGEIGRNSARSIRKGERRPTSNRSVGSRQSDENEIAGGSTSSRGALRRNRSNSRDRSTEQQEQCGRPPTSQRSLGSRHSDENEIASGSSSSRGILRRNRSNSRDRSADQQQEERLSSSQRSFGSSNDGSATKESAIRSRSEVAELRREMSDRNRSKDRKPGSGTSQHETQVRRTKRQSHHHGNTDHRGSGDESDPGRRKSGTLSSTWKESPASRSNQPVKRTYSADDIILSPSEDAEDGEFPQSPPGTPVSASRERRTPGRSSSGRTGNNSQALYRSPRTPRKPKKPGSNQADERSPPNRSQSEHLVSPRHSSAHGSSGGPTSSLKGTKSMPRHSMSSRMSSSAMSAVNNSEIRPPISPNMEERDYLRKKDELEYKMQLFREYRRLSKEEGMSDDDILSIFPEMKMVIKKHQPDAN